LPILLVSAALACSSLSRPAVVRGGDAADPLAETYKLASAGDTSGAIAAAKRAVQADPKAYFPRVRLAWLSLATDPAASADAYHQAALLEPNAVEPLLGEQQCLIALERWEQAEKIGREVVRRDPQSYLGLSRLAWTLYKHGDAKGAAGLYAKVVALYPGDVDMRVGLGASLLAQGQRVDAAAAYNAALAMYPGHAIALQGIAACKGGK
jgi:tetratricopeptide (TPR) repeat protein